MFVSLCLNRHVRIVGGPPAANCKHAVPAVRGHNSIGNSHVVFSVTRALKALAWVSGLYPAQTRQVRCVQC